MTRYSELEKAVLDARTNAEVQFPIIVFKLTNHQYSQLRSNMIALFGQRVIQKRSTIFKPGFRIVQVHVYEIYKQVWLFVQD